MEVRFVDLFAGAGGATAGLKRRLKPVGAVEWNPIAAESYRRNHGDHVIVEDIRKVSWRMLIERFGPIDHLHFSPPCQEFSPLGLRGGWESERGGLMWEPYRLLREAMIEGTLPRTIDMENVKGLSFRQYADAFKDWRSALSGLGYTLGWRVVNMADYGVSQTRERVILVGDMDGKLQLPAPTHDKSAWITGAQALGVDDSEPFLWVDDTYNKPSRDGKPRVFDLSKRPAPTVDARSGGRPKLGRPGEEVAGKPEHWATFQGFPKDYAFYGKVVEQAMQIGNACPPPFFAMLSEEIYAVHAESKGEMSA
jgi:DNA (cytosine-5)-methyltransferase 1